MKGVTVGPTPKWMTKRLEAIGQRSINNLVDLGNYRDSRPGEGPLIDESRIELDTDGTLTGSRRTFRWAKGRRIHFAMHVSPKPDRITLYADTQSVNGAIVFFFAPMMPLSDG